MNNTNSPAQAKAADHIKTLPNGTPPGMLLQHSGKRDYAPELIRGSQGSGCDRPAIEGPNKNRADASPAPTQRVPEPTKTLANGTTLRHLVTPMSCETMWWDRCIKLNSRKQQAQ